LALAALALVVFGAYESYPNQTAVSYAVLSVIGMKVKQRRSAICFFLRNPYEEMFIESYWLDLYINVVVNMGLSLKITKLRFFPCFTFKIAIELPLTGTSF